MPRPISLTLRLSLLFGIVAMVVFSTFGWFIEDSIKHHFTVEDTSELEIVAQAVDKALSGNLTKDNLASLERRFDDILVGHHGASLHIADSRGRTRYASIGPDLTELTLKSRSMDDGLVRSWSDGQHTYRVLTRQLGSKTPLIDQTYTIAVAVPLDFHLRFLDSFRYTLWLMIASGIVITSLMGWFAVRQGHAPLHAIVAQIRRISANELNTRLSPGTVPRELADLAFSFNEMLDRIEEAFLRLTDFSADIAHELRTPVTSLMMQSQVALSQTRNIDEYREVLYSNIEEYERMAQMIGDMLFLAQADNGLCKPDNAKVNLTTEVCSLFDYYEALAEERHVNLSVAGDARTSGDRSMLRRALNNLLANAIRYTATGGTVAIHLEQLNSGEASIVMENPGRDITSKHLTRLFDRFYRVDPSRHEGGTGLGLAIVKSIINAHSGTIKVTSSEGFTRFHITLPNP